MILLDVKMPSNCFECPMRGVDGLENFCQTNYKSDLSLHNLPDWCPIVAEIPKGHGRLIDADALKKVYETTEDAEYCQWTLYGVTSEIDDAETIIEADKVENEDGKMFDKIISIIFIAFLSFLTIIAIINVVLKITENVM